jgi:hypothetical protein
VSEEWSYDSRSEQAFFLFCTNFIPFWGPTTSHLVPSDLTGTKQALCEAEHSPPRTGEFTNEWSCTFTTSYSLVLCTGAILPSQYEGRTKRRCVILILRFLPRSTYHSAPKSGEGLTVNQQLRSKFLFVSFYKPSIRLKTISRTLTL